MKLAVIQSAATGPEAVLRADLRAQVMALAAMGVDLVVLPELIVPGYNHPQAHRALAAPLDGATCRAMAALAQEAGLAVAYGWAERDGDAVYNAASVIGPDGARLAHYRKIQLFGAKERASFTPGAAPPPVFDYMGRKIGLLICYDIEFPEHGRALGRMGADLALVPTANPAGYEHVQELLVPARAYENRMIVVYANYCGQDGDVRFGGRSVIAGPDGGVLASAGVMPATLITELPNCAAYPAALLSDQRADLRQV